ncbi:MAG: recombination protein RecR [Planctomycetaceae bacterium]|nr:MAG: recombination protein RecR [Planctomycetaceae bacterium]
MKDRRRGFPDQLAEHPYGPTVARLQACLGRLPGIGPRTAERLTLHLINAPLAEALELADALREVRARIHPCPECFNLTEAERCSICQDPRRDRDVVCVVEQPRDVLALEASGVYRGLYHVLGGRISPLQGIGPDELTIEQLKQRIQLQGIREVVMATNPNLEGDGTALYISNVLADTGVKITRLARGIATGSVLEFANREMLADALLGRQSF